MFFTHYSWVTLGSTPDMNQSSPEKRCQKIHPKSFPPIQLLDPCWQYLQIRIFRGKVIRIYVFSLPERGVGSFILLSTFLSYQNSPALCLQTFLFSYFNSVAQWNRAPHCYKLSCTVLQPFYEIYIPLSSVQLPTCYLLSLAQLI